MTDRRFRNRQDAGRLLAVKLAPYADRPDVLVLALPRGGVPVGFEVAEALRVPLDVFIVRKLGVPGQPEYAMGAIATGGVRVLNDSVVRMLDIDSADIEAITLQEQDELARRELLYRDGRPAPEVGNHTLLVVDDGLATGSTMRAAVQALRALRPTRIVVAVPTASAETCEQMRSEADEVVCLQTPEPFRAVGLWYEDFSQTSDDEVRALLARARHALAHHA